MHGPEARWSGRAEASGLYLANKGNSLMIFFEEGSDTYIRKINLTSMCRMDGKGKRVEVSEPFKQVNP